MKKNTKKTATVVGMFGLLGLVLGMGGSTFAKYQTVKSIPATQATVAKWNMVAQVTGTGFATSYNSDAVKSSTDGLVVAPGTKGTISFAISGQSEVKGEATFVWTLTDNVNDGASYSPIDWTFNSKVYSADSKKADGTAADGDLAALKTAIDSYKVSFAAGNSISESFSISWEWKFETGANDDEKAANNAKDTAIAAAAKTLSYELTATISQVQ